MSLQLRNLLTDPASPVSMWPTEAIQTALDRGGLAEWRRIATEIRKEPWGRTSRQLEEILGHDRPYGVAEAMESVIADARRAAEQGEREAVARAVRAALVRSGLTRTAFASRIGTSASRLSTYATGTVMPSAALMLRMEGVADRRARDTAEHVTDDS